MLIGTWSIYEDAKAIELLESTSDRSGILQACNELFNGCAAPCCRSETAPLLATAHLMEDEFVDDYGGSIVDDTAPFTYGDPIKVSVRAKYCFEFSSQRVASRQWNSMFSERGWRPSCSTLSSFQLVEESGDSWPVAVEAQV